MNLSISSPGTDLTPDEVARIEKDLEKIDRRLRKPDEAFARLRVTNGTRAPSVHVVLELDYHKHHFIGKADNSDVGIAVREARDEIVRQITDAKGGHSSYSRS